MHRILPIVFSAPLAAMSVLLLAAAHRPMPPEQQTVVTGLVSGHNGQSLDAASISAAGRNVTAVTGPDGRFRLRVSRSADYERATLHVQRAGYDSRDVRVVLHGDSMEVNVSLTPAAVRKDAPPVAEQSIAATGAAVATRMSLGADVGRRTRIAAPAANRQSDLRWRRGHPDSGNTEAYDRITENAFRSPRVAPLSTFSADVDRASYSNVRRFLSLGTLPPVDAVRVEELVNYFRYADPTPGANEPPLRISTEVAAAPWNPRHELVRIALRARDVDMRRAPANNLVFLVDVSGSMQGPTRLPLVKESLRLLVNQLRDEDRVAIVVYAGNAGLVLPSTGGGEKQRILAALDGLEAGGSTAGGAGIKLAYDVARANVIRGGNNRVILCTDGDFNVGQSSDGELVRLIEDRRREGAFLTILGFGMGNYKDAKMEKLAGAGNGNYGYIDDLLEARKILVQEMGGTLLTVAKDVKLQVEFNPDRVQAYRLLGYEDRLLRDEDFANDAKDAGDIGAGHTVTVLYEIVPSNVPLDVSLPGVSPLRYQALPKSASRDDELLHVAMRYKAPDGEESRLVTHPVRAGRGNASESMRFASAVAGFGMLLRQSPNAGALTWPDVLTLARGARGHDEDGYRSEFIRLAEVAASLQHRGEVGVVRDR